MEVVCEKDWIVSFPLKVDINELIVWARRIQCQSQGNPSLTGEHATGMWWYAETHPLLKQRLQEIVELNPDWPSSIWEWHDGGPLLKHSDGIGRGASLVAVLVGKFEIFSHCPETGKILDSYIYGPGEIIALKNGHRTPHSGRCLQGYRLAVCTFATNENDPFRDYGKMKKSWKDDDGLVS